MRVPQSPEELWHDHDDEDERDVPAWIDHLANLGIAIGLIALLATPVALILLYFQVQPYANMLIMVALLGGLLGMFLGFGEQIAKARGFRD